ncbi:MAG: DUF4366 domain-containing protein [Clostridiales bacterium]|nr:DUF4366 domain-containing protein [Clostridiales bacterium]
MNKVEELIAASKIGELMNRKQHEEEKKCKMVWIIAIVAAVAAVAGIGFALYKYFSSKCYDEFEDDFEYDEFDDDFFEDDFEEK